MPSLLESGPEKGPGPFDLLVLNNQWDTPENRQSSGEGCTVLGFFA